ncbi:MAG: polyprenyl glycosylphosphotransferase [Crocinitomicaceae bacterium]|jgi:exopolysaccharide biosynthesis polyprenyl glycosylphosphotransferase|nr:polyprenyl glycosylphosphotransferase [Crocinitomicaceae bacterium]|tara:strand:+ start:437 stop:1834 length:1398 start_codon:yes stop_codon:yes gene_type:complete
MKKKYFWNLYLFFDFISAGSSWILFNYFRKTYIEKYDFEVNDKLIISTFFISLFWILLYSIFGNYRNVYKKYRLKEITQIISQTFIGIILIFFTFLLDDNINSYQDYYSLFVVLFLLHIIITFIPRIILTSRTVNQIHNKKIGFNTIVIGSSQKAKDTYLEICNLKKATGHFIIGYVCTNGGKDVINETGLKKLGAYNEISQIINNEKIEEVIIATEPKEHEKINSIINDLADLKVEIKVVADMYSILTGSVKMNSIFGALLISVNPEMMPSWQKTVKRIMDLFISIIAIIILSPVFIILTIFIKSGSKGEIIFKQERIGFKNEPFQIYKFRSMYADSEKNGPQLSSKYDSRITNIGRFMRKTRLDETPQFFNVIKGDMSLVGPRPERQYFINKIIDKAPHYKHLSKVKPGITSWGQVKYGYAENVDEMIARLKFDLLYVENMSLSLDVKILFYTVIIMLKGSGK